MKHAVPVFDGDGHLLENESVFDQYCEGSWKGNGRLDRISIFLSLATNALACGLKQSEEFRTATVTAYNNSPDAEYTRKDDRLYGVCLVPFNDIDAMRSDRVIYASDFPHEPTEDDLTADAPDFLADNAYSMEVKEKARYGIQKMAFPRGVRGRPRLTLLIALGRRSCARGVGRPFDSRDSQVLRRRRK